MSSITQRINFSFRAVRTFPLPLLVVTLALGVLGPACSSAGDDSTQGDVAGAGNGGNAGSAGSKGPPRSGSGGQSDGGSDFAGSNVSDGGDDAHGESGRTSATGGSDSGGGQKSAAGGAGNSSGGADQAQGGTLPNGGAPAATGGIAGADGGGDTGGGGGPAAAGGIAGAYGGGTSGGTGGTRISTGGGSGVGGSPTASCFVDHDCIDAGGVCTGVASGSVCVAEQDTCASDADCSRKEYCDGYCRPAAGFGQPCSSSGRCGIGPPGYSYPLVCNMGRCLVPYETLVYQPYPCASNNDCGDGTVCRFAGISPGYPQCLSPSGPGGRCGGAADCQDGLCCVRSTTVAACQAKPGCGVTGMPIDCNTGACPTNTHCDYVQASSCLVNLPEGSDCTPVAGKETYGAIPCAEGLYCGETADHLLRCQTSSGEGQPCVVARDNATPGQPACNDSYQLGCSPCALGLYCDSGNTCRRPAGYHEDCAATACATGLRCVPATLGGSCSGTPDQGAGGASGGSSGSGGQPGNACSDPPSFKNPALSAVVADQMRRAGITQAGGLQALSYVGDYTIGDLSGLECLTGLKSLTLQGSAIHDLSPIGALTQLTNLQVQGTGVSDLHALSALSNLTTLSLTASAVVDLSPLSGLTGLTSLNLTSNAIVDLTPISGLVHLTLLTLSANQILELDPLLDNAGLATGSSVSVTSNPFDCAGQAANMKALTDRGVNLSVSCPLHCDGTAPHNPASKIGIGSGSQCVLLRDGRVECWGSNQYSQLGDGSGSDSIVPVLTMGVSSAVDISVGYTGSCALLSSGEVSCWGAIYGAGVNGSVSPIAGVSQATAIATDSSLACVIVTDGKVQCWGWNASGGWGDGSQPGLNVRSTAPTSNVLGISHAISIAVSEMSACAVLSDGSAWCWGDSLPNGPTSSSNVPVRVTGITSARKVFAGAEGQRCLLLSDGTVRCWGPTQTAGTPTVPTAIPGLTQVVDVALGSVRQCAVLQNGTVRCWGKAPLGDGQSVDSDSPVLVSGITNAVGIGVGLNADAVCALLTDGSIRCWGWPLGTTGGEFLSPDCVPKL